MTKHIDRFNQLKNIYNQFIEDPKNSKLRIRDVSNRLNVSEAELLSLSTNKGIFHLKIDDFDNFFKSILKENDKVMFLIRTDFVVHEKIISCQDYTIKNDRVFSLKDKSTLIKFNSDSIKYSFYEFKKHKNRTLRSFQFFDKDGNSMIKIYLKGKSKDQFDFIANKYKVEYNYELQKNFESNKFDNEYKSIDYDENVIDLTLRKILNKIAEDKIPVNIYAFGLDCTQCHSDTIKNVIDYGPWLNVMDKNFNIHVLEKNITVSNHGKRDGNNFIDFNDSNDSLVLSISANKKYNDIFNVVFEEDINE